MVMHRPYMTMDMPIRVDPERPTGPSAPGVVLWRGADRCMPLGPSSASSQPPGHIGRRMAPKGSSTPLPWSQSVVHMPRGFHASRHSLHMYCYIYCYSFRTARMQLVRKRMQGYKVYRAPCCAARPAD